MLNGPLAEERKKRRIMKEAADNMDRGNDHETSNIVASIILRG
jgi:hypothetical protein